MWKEFEEDPEVEAVFLMDAANAFNRLNREQALFIAEVRKSWPRAARFIFNAYKGYKMIFVDGTDEILYSKDGCTQGDPIAMLLYGVGVKPLFVVVKEKVARSSMTRARSSSRCCLQMIPRRPQARDCSGLGESLGEGAPQVWLLS
mmetsp:Transcript_93003/g.212805  ORF Transcript_93003/g.212805 Transcript_93003/m.212805 type:complete len:146 (+) Transcript_93003:131-568(+)